jgi:hypothetical protein
MALKAVRRMGVPAKTVAISANAFTGVLLVSLRWARITSEPG